MSTQLEREELKFKFSGCPVVSADGVAERSQTKEGKDERWMNVNTHLSAMTTTCPFNNACTFRRLLSLRVVTLCMPSAEHMGEYDGDGCCSCSCTRRQYQP